jgi:DNA-binding transcriptional LysR family regulator
MNDFADSLDIWLIRVLRTLLTERSVTQAAVRLNQTQPAISTALRRLREILNDPILVRGKQGMVPTEYGASLLAATQRALREVDFVSTPHGEFDPSSSRRTFRVAAPDYLNDFFMPTLIAEFRAAAPNARLEIESLTPTLDHERALDEGELDLVVGNWARPEPRFAREDLFSDIFVCLMRREHPLARAPLTLERYALAAHLAPTPYSGGKPHPIDIGLARAGIRRRIVTTIPYFGLVPQVLLQSDLIFTATRRFALHHAAMLPLAVMDSPVVFPRIKCYLLSLPQSERPTDVAWLRALVVRVSEGLTKARASSQG